MAYCLLTGSTGLLGRYLLRDLLLAGRRVAVLARPARQETARRRVEAVMSDWEGAGGRALPRPVVLEGDLCRASLGLSDAGRRWVADHCRAVVHSAASMTFRPDKHGEPARTNVDGTRWLLEFCRESGIREFHHVSTAYVCGLREGRVLESELDCGQQLGNIYEKSKLEGEKLLRQSDFLDVLTVYRPASLVGDSQTGYTTSYHGVYLPLQLACAMADKIPPKEMNDRFLARLRLEGSEGKNLVPVDWVSAAIAYLVTHAEHHGKTFHLASPKPTAVRLIQEIVQEALRRYYKRPVAAAAGEEALAGYEKLFQEYMSVYQSHWRNDPTFDLTASGRALSHLPCPQMDRDRLLCLAKFAVDNGFNPPRRRPVATEFDAHGYLDRFAAVGQSPEAGAAGDCPALEITGRGGGQWQLVLRDGALLRAAVGVGPEDSDGYYLNSETFGAIVHGRVPVEQAVYAGRLLIRCRKRSCQELTGILEQLVSSSPR